MELLEFKNKFLEICNVSEVSELKNRLMEIVIDNEINTYDNCSKLLNEDRDMIQALYQYYQADRTDKKQDYTPKTLSRLVASLIDNDSKIIYDSCAGSGSLTLEILKNKDVKVICKELDENVIPFLLFNLCINNANGYVELCDVLKNEVYKIYEVVSQEKYSIVKEVDKKEIEIADNAVSNPPFNIKTQKGNANYDFVDDCIKNSNKAIIILPTGALTSSQELDARKKLINSDLLECVISLPINMFESTTVATCILVLNKNKKHKNEYIFIDSSKNCEVEEREQRGQFGGASHTNRIYKKKYNVLSEDNIIKIINSIDDWKDIKEFAKIVTSKEVEENQYNYNPIIYFDIEFEKEKHRPIVDIVENINYIKTMKNSCKIVINENLAKSIGFDVEFYKKAENIFSEFEKYLNIKIVDDNYISFTKNKNEFVFKCNDKEMIPNILMQFLGIWKNQIAMLNDMENHYLIELRDILISDLMSGEIKLGVEDKK